MFKFLHAADIHLDSPLRKLNFHKDLPAEAIQGATRRAFAGLIDLAIAEGVKFVLIAGDVYDGDAKDYATGLWLVDQLQRLAEAKIPLFLIRGNHDAQNKVLKDLPFPSLVHRFPTNKPDVFVLDDLGVAIHGQGFAQASVTDDLAQGYPKARSGLLNIGLLHTSATGYEGHERYAPCSLDTLRGKGYAYWALGHVHTREVLDQGETHIVFPGNTQGRHIRETGAKGCMLVTVDDRHELTACEFRALDVLRWERCLVDATDCDDPDGLVDRFSREAARLLDRAEGRSLVVRVEVTGRTTSHDAFLAQQNNLRNQLSARAIEVGNGQIWVEKVKFSTSPLRSISYEEIDNDALMALEETIDLLRGDTQALVELSASLFAGLKKKLPDELSGPEGVNFSDEVWLREMLDSVRPIFLTESNKTLESR